MPEQQGKCQDASALLAPVYGWVTEGFNTADLQKAKALLDGLGGPLADRPLAAWKQGDKGWFK